MDTANDVKLLNEIFQNARIGVNAISLATSPSSAKNTLISRSGPPGSL